MNSIVIFSYQSVIFFHQIIVLYKKRTVHVINLVQVELWRTVIHNSTINLEILAFSEDFWEKKLLSLACNYSLTILSK